MYVENKVFETPVSNLTLLKRIIEWAMGSLTQEVIDIVSINLDTRSDAIIIENRGRAEYLQYWNKNLWSSHFFL